MKYPRIQQGLGSLNAKVFNQIMDQLEGLSVQDDPKQSVNKLVTGRPFLATLTNAVELRTLDGFSSDVYGNRYLYEWREVYMYWANGGRNHAVEWKLNSDGSYYREGTIGTSFADCTAAVNLVEMQNTARGAGNGFMGPGIQLNDTTAPLEIDSTEGNLPNSVTGQVVQIFPLTYPKPSPGSGVDTFYVFNQDNPIDCSTTSFRASTFNFSNDLGSDWGVLRDYDVDLGGFS